MFDQKKLIIFDVDGVLLDNKMGGFKDILILLGKEKEVGRIDEEYQKRKHMGPWGLEELAALYTGFSRLELEKTAMKYCQRNLMSGAREAINLLKGKNYLIGAISSNPQFIMDILTQMLGFNFGHGTELEFQNDLATSRIVKKVDRYIKAEILERKMAELDVRKENTIVVGDSLTDLPIAEVAGKFIAFNAKPEVYESADIMIKTKDLREVLKYIY